ncbi:MAG: CoB--CoM heterodisulfide reductase iron-sulfur subunit A family protein, partial [Proteobacteria bacterium]|nr:CoB--CoM heterodisulfide reductase iron-sulfur subunit A family protein [Pseudomonadota bacterium]
MKIKVENHALIETHMQAEVADSIGEVGRFLSVVQKQGEENPQTLEHGVVIFATGGGEAAADSFGYGENEAIVTQKELEGKLAEETIDPGKLNSVVMVQCVGSREEPRNYCSRVCCASALKNALFLKEKNPDVAVYIFYRDIMAYGNIETYYTKARKAGIVFIQYPVDNKPQVSTEKNSVKVKGFEPILGRDLEIEADLVVLATGVVSALPRETAESLGAAVDQDGFFQEAESKWRPVDSLKEGIFACGLTHSPRNIDESIASAEAAAQRALRVLGEEKLAAGKVVAEVRHSICALCERCIDACPYGARTIDPETESVNVNPVMCQGCGSCAAVCPNSASIVAGFHDSQMLDVIDSMLEGATGS